MLLLLHGYLLEGSGSNLWTRNVMTSLVRKGQTVHLACQEGHPGIYDIISEVRHHLPDGSVEKVLERDVPYPGRCIMHRPILGNTLPVYVWDHYDEFSDVRPMATMDTAELEGYLETNMNALRKVIDTQAEEGDPITAILANHAVLMSVVARRLSEETGIPFSIMPHGSAIEYAVKKDERLFRWAEEAFSAATTIFVIGDEIRDRVIRLFPEIWGLPEKVVELNLGADTTVFEVVPKDRRRASIEELVGKLEGIRGGRPADNTARLLGGWREGGTGDDLVRLSSGLETYDAKLPDEDAGKKLRGIDWENDEVLFFVGRLIGSKGLQNILVGLPEVLRSRPNLRLVVTGHGPLREILELMVHALSVGDGETVMTIIREGTGLEMRGKGTDGGHGTTGMFEEARDFFHRLQDEGRMEGYIQQAMEAMGPDRVTFVGYLTHHQLRHLFPCTDVAVFPSVVKEAGPLVFLEAMASGVFPIGTDFGGMKVSIDRLSDVLPEDVLQTMRVRIIPEHTVSDIIDSVVTALGYEGLYSTTLRKVAVDRYDWSRIADRLSTTLGVGSSTRG